MLSRSLMASVLIVLVTLAIASFLVGCSQTTTTRTAETEATIAADVCTVWQPVSYSSRDTDETRLDVRANNAA